MMSLHIFIHEIILLYIALYIQTIQAIRILYHCAKLVHADLSEYNILVCPMSQVENALDKSNDAKDNLQIVLIDFGQAVEIRHPSARDLLRRDLTMIKTFYDKQGIKTLNLEESEEFILKECDYGMEEVDESDDEEEEQGEDNIDEFNIDVFEVKPMKSNEDVEKDEEEENIDPEVKPWRHSIPNWDDLKDMAYIESRLDQIS